MSINYEARVNAGAALLDEKYPDWFKTTDLDILDISSGDRCVTAQLYTTHSGDSPNEGSWIKGMDMLDLTRYEDVENVGSYIEHGFNAEGHLRTDGGLWDDDYSQDAVYDILNALWRSAIGERRSNSQ